MHAAARQKANFLAVIRPFSYYSLRQLRPRIWLSWPVGIEGETPLLVRTPAYYRCLPPPRSIPTPSRSWCWSPPRTHWACRAVRPHDGTNYGLVHFLGRHCRCSAHPNNNKKTERIRKKKYTASKEITDAQVFIMNYVCATHLSSVPAERLKFSGDAQDGQRQPE